jgi:hypothetical protein
MSAPDSPERLRQRLSECDQKLWDVIDAAKAENATPALIRKLEDLQVHLVLARQVADRQSEGGAR